MSRSFIIPTIYTAVDRTKSTISNMFARMDRGIAAAEAKYGRIGEMSQKLAIGSAVIGTALAAPFVMAARQSIKFEDALADVSKTTNLKGAGLQKLGDDILGYSTKTRSSIEDLSNIAMLGGTMGIAQDQMSGFIKSADKFNIALGKDFGSVEEAVRSVGSIRNLFAETRNLKADESINKVGSAINALTSEGAKATEMANFVARMGALPDAIKPSITNTVALSAVFDKAGISAEIAASGFQNLTLLAGRNIPAFAKQMKLSAGEASKLLNTDPSSFAIKLSESFKGMNTVQISERMKDLKINSNEVMKTIGALGANFDEFTKFQKIANDQFATGSSLAEEAATKNATIGAKMQMAKNGVHALAITVGDQLKPALNSIMDRVLPLITSMTKWASENKSTVKTIGYIAAGLSGFAFTLSGLATAIGVVIAAKKAWAIAQTTLNITMSANPIGLIILGIAGLVAGIMWLASKTNGWGKQWDETWSLAKALFTFTIKSIQLGFMVFIHKFMSGVEFMVSKWLWFQNMIGVLSDEAYKNSIAKIEAEKKARIGAMHEISKEMAKSGQRIQEGYTWHVEWNKQDPAPGSGVRAVNPYETQAGILKSVIEKKETKEVKIKVESNNSTVDILNNDGIDVDVPFSIRKP